MDTGCYKFYRNKWIMISYVFLCGMIILFPAFSVRDKEEVHVLILCWIYAFFMLKKFVVPFLRKEPYVEITPLYIQLAGEEKLLWTDIDRIEKKSLKRGYRLNLWPKNISKYHLNWIQRVNIKLGCSPFYFVDSIMRREDAEKLIEILKGRVPNNNLG